MISAMFTNNNNASAKNIAGKRKMKEVAAEAAAHNKLPPNGGGGSRHSQVQQILNTAAPHKPFSFMSLLTSEDNNNNIDPNSLITYNRNQSEEIDQIISLHCENLKQALRLTTRAHQRKIYQVVKKLKEKESELQLKTARNTELERLSSLYKGEAERLLTRVRHFERTNMSLKASLQEANEARRYAETEQEEAESSFEDPNRVGPVRLDCKVCQRQLATIMIWPCRHMCVCKGCNAVTKFCPVCCTVKTNGVEVFLPHN